MSHDPSRWDVRATRSNLTVANAVTVARIIATPIFGLLWWRGDGPAALWLFVATVATDFVDGFLARILDQRSRLGALLDPIADKWLALIAIIVGISVHAIPIWWAAVTVGRELVIGFGVLLGATKYRERHGAAEWRPTRLGKYAMAWQSVAIALIVVEDTLHPAGLRAWPQTAMVMSALLTLISGTQYVVRASLAVWGKPANQGAT